MNLVIDYGNSSAKVGIFDQQKLIEKHVFHSLESLKDYVEKFDAENIIISSVSKDPYQIATWPLRAKLRLVLDQKLPIPILNHYSTPSSLGVDRLAAVCGAQFLFPKNNCLVIDAGTCITYDFIDNQANYLGGGISPGMIMRFQSMNTFTAKLPLVQPVLSPALIGNSTESCMQSGVVNGLLAEMSGIIEEYQKKFGNLKVILCGGDAAFFENQMKEVIFAVPELVLSGLNSILIYNVDL